MVRGEMSDSTFRLLACTGAITNEIRGQYHGEWLAGGEPKADLVTFSMGGNNIGFADVVFECIGISIEGGVSAAFQGPYAMSLNPAIGCITSETELRRRIDMLVGNGPDERSAFDNSQTLPDMYRELAENAVNPGGHVIVLGYPNIVEESGRWTMGWLEGNRCSRIRRSDTAMLRSAAGYLNEQIARAVQQADNAYRGVRFHWLDVSQVYESAGGRHGLCTGDPWINGITLGIAGPHSGNLDGRLMRSFHPNQKGHDATGAAVAAVVSGLDWTELKRDLPPSQPDGPAASEQVPGPVERDDILGAVLPPATCGWIAESTGLQLFNGVTPGVAGGEEISVDIDNPSRVVFGDLDGDGVGDAAFALDCYGGGNAIWNEVIVQLAGQGPYIVGWDVLTSAPGVPAGVTVNSLGLFNADNGVGVSWYGQLPDDPNCCPSRRFESYVSISSSGATVERTIGIDPDTGDPFEL
jgi:hypothetical protein